MNWLAVLLSMTVPAVLIGAYPGLRALAPRAPNKWVGYRTRRSMSSRRNWEVAQLLAARSFLQIAIPLTILMAVAFVVLARSGIQDEDTWYSVGVWAGVALLPAFGWIFHRVEKCLRDLDQQSNDEARSPGGGGEV